MGHMLSALSEIVSQNFEDDRMVSQGKQDIFLVFHGPPGSQSLTTQLGQHIMTGLSTGQAQDYNLSQPTAEAVFQGETSWDI
jgi:hypothetical protein